MFWFSIKDGLVAVYLVRTKPSRPMYYWELAFDNDIVTGDCILNSNADELKTAMNHRVE